MDNREGLPLRAAVIDDDRDMVKVIRVMLKVKGIETIEAFSGLSGVAMVKREHPDIVLLDIMMPDIDGFEVLRKLSFIMLGSLWEDTDRAAPAVR